MSQSRLLAHSYRDLNLAVNQLMGVVSPAAFLSKRDSCLSTQAPPPVMASPTVSRKRPLEEEDEPGAPVDLSQEVEEPSMKRPTVFGFNPYHYNPNQLTFIDWVKGQLDSFFPVHCNYSKMGSGKTRATCGLALRMNLAIFAICPGTVTSWKEETLLTGARLAENMTLGAVRSVTDSQPKHGYLKRIERFEEVEVKAMALRNSRIAPGTRFAGRQDESTIVKKVVFEVTRKFKDLVASGILLVVDESHGTKNNSDQSRAVSAMVSYIVSTRLRHRSRVMLLSGTPYTSTEHVTQTLRVMGLCDSTPWVRDSPLESYEPSETNRFVSLCETVDEQALQSLLSSMPRKSISDCQKLTYELFTTILKSSLVSFLASPILKTNFDNKRGYYKTSAFDSAAISVSIQNIQKATRLNASGQRVAFSGEQSRVMMEMEQIHLAKIEMAVRLAKTRLDSDPTRHVILFTQFHSTVDQLVEELMAYSPLVLTGKISKYSERAEVIKSFHSSKSRVLIANMQVGGVGLNLGDMVGNAPRSILIFPTYLATDVYQSMYRCYRLGTKSDVECRLMFCLSNEVEKKLLESFAKTSKVWADVLTQQMSEGEKFMSGLPEERETESSESSD